MVDPPSCLPLTLNDSRNQQQKQLLVIIQDKQFTYLMEYKSKKSKLKLHSVYTKQVL